MSVRERRGGPEGPRSAGVGAGGPGEPRTRTEPEAHALREVERKQRGKFRLPAFGLLQSLKVTLRQLLSRAVTVHYPDERMELPARTRGVIALLEENCTVCMLCAKECPCWCIYIEGHKVQKPGRRKPVNELDRFAIDFGLCMYCGICVEVCPFDALHWSPAFEYTAYTYEGLVHEAPVLAGWQDHVLPPPQLVDDAEDKAREIAQVARDKRTEGVWALIREKDKQEAYLHRQQAAAAPAVQPAAPPSGQVPSGPAPGAAAPPQPAAVSSDTSPEDAPIQAEIQAPASGPPEPAASAAAPHDPSPGPTATTPVPETGDIPRIDPLNLPGGIGPVERGRLKKLAVLQERGQAPPPDLIENLRAILDQMKGGG